MGAELDLDLNVELAGIDAMAYRAAVRATHRYYARMLECHKTGCELHDQDIWEDVRETLYQSIRAACHKARSRWDEYCKARQTALAFARVPTASVKRMLREADADQRHALDQLYAKIAASATTSTMSKVRNRLIQDVANRRVRTLESRVVRQDVRSSLRQLGISAERGATIATAIKAQTSIAFNATVWREGLRDPELWGWEYVTARDERVRPEHAILEGVRYPKAHSFWRLFVPPNGWNCRCTLRPIYFGDPRATIRPLRTREPFIAPEFRFNPGGIFFLTA